MSLPNGTKIIKGKGLDARNQCDGILTCTSNYADEKNCPNQFYCPNGNGTKISIPKKNVCDGVVDCDNEWDENKTACQHRFFCSSLRRKKVSLACTVPTLSFLQNSFLNTNVEDISRSLLCL